MPYDFYDYFIEKRSSPIFTPAEDVVRQKFWRESIDMIKAEEWLEMEEKIRMDLYYFLRYV